MVPINHYQLANGLNIYFCPDKNKNMVSVNLIVNFGGQDTGYQINNQDYQLPNGIAHYIEHLLLEKSKFGNLMTLMGEKQLMCNGSTSINHTAYYFDAFKNVDYGLKILLKGINNPAFKPEDIEVIKDPIYQEIRMSDDNKYRIAYKLACQNLFHQIPYESVIGRMSDIQKIDYDMVKRCYEVFYQPSNQTIIILGRVNEEHMLKLITDIYQQTAKPVIPYQPLSYAELPTVVKSYTKYHMPTGNNLISLQYKVSAKGLTGSARKEWHRALMMLLNMNFGQKTATLHQLVEQGLVIESVDYYLYFIKDQLLIVIIADSKKPTALVKALLKIIKNPDFNQELFDLNKNDQIMRLGCCSEEIGRVLSLLLGNLVNYQLPKIDTVADIEQFTKQKYEAIIKQINLDNYTVVEIENS